MKPVAPRLIEKDTNTIGSVISFENVRLEQALRKLAEQANLKVSLDPAISPKTLGQTVMLRWENLTARQALAELLDNYDLAMVEEAASKAARIMTKNELPTNLHPRKNKFLGRFAQRTSHPNVTNFLELNHSCKLVKLVSRFFSEAFQAQKISTEASC
jgi:type II secretory pathway component GspD/PulD (secretin)